MAIHTFGEYLDFHPHLHALVADGLFDREGRFHVMRTGELTGELTQGQRGTTDAFFAGNHAALEQLYRARVIAFLVEAGLLPLDGAAEFVGCARVMGLPTIDASCVGTIAGLAALDARDPGADFRTTCSGFATALDIIEHGCSFRTRLPVGGAGIEVVFITAAVTLEPLRAVAVLVSEAE